MTAPALPVSTVPVPATTPLARLRWTLADGMTLLGRELGRLRQQPGELVAALIFPAIMVVLFGFVFGSAIKVPGGGNYREYLMPGLFAMVTFSSIMAVTMKMATDASRGVMDRFRSMPMSRSAVPFGQVTADTLIGGVIGLGIMVVAGLLVGWRPHNGLGPTLGAFALLIVARYAISWVGCWLGLVVKNEQTADALVPLTLPVTMLSNAFVPTEGMPAWLRFIADWNPVSAITAACRDMFGNPGAPLANASWPLTHPIITTLAWCAVLLLVFVPLSVRTYRRKGR